MARLVYNDAELHQLLEAPAGPTGQMLLRKATNVRVRAEQIASEKLTPRGRRVDSNGNPRIPYHQGFVSGVTASPLQGFAGNDSDIAMLVDVGSKPHPIRARRAPLLVFYWARVGHVVRFKAVNHPGTSAKHVLTSALPAAAN